MPRIDTLLASSYPHLSRATIQKLIKKGYVMLQGTVVTKPSFAVEEHLIDEIVVDLSPLNVTDTDSLALEILYEDENCVVVNKPAGILTHSKGVFSPEETIASWLHSREHYNFTEPNDRSGIVHRLDRATSGVIICAKNPDTHGFLQKQFQQRTTKKTYLAVIEGSIQPPEAIIDMPLSRHPRKPQTFRVHPDGKPSKTYYKTLRTSNDKALLQLQPETGRTHQLRVHLSHLHHPIVGDTLYGGKHYTRMLLHAESLEITLPGGVRKCFTARPPEEFTI